MRGRAGGFYSEKSCRSREWRQRAAGGWPLYLRIREWLAGQGPRSPSSRDPRHTSSRAPPVSLRLPASLVTSRNPDLLGQAWGTQLRTASSRPSCKEEVLANFGPPRALSEPIKTWLTLCCQREGEARRVGQGKAKRSGPGQMGNGNK